MRAEGKALTHHPHCSVSWGIAIKATQTPMGVTLILMGLFHLLSNWTEKKSKVVTFLFMFVKTAF